MDVQKSVILFPFLKVVQIEPMTIQGQGGKQVDGFLKQNLVNLFKHGMSISFFSDR
jgi:hypothetical protein